MTVQRRYLIAGALIALVVVTLVAVMSIEQLVPPRRTAVRPAPPQPAVATAHINATLFYGSLDGQALIPLRREVPLAAGVVAQGAQILRAQLAAAPEPLVSVIPKGTSLRAFYVTDRGDAFVDLSDVQPVPWHVEFAQGREHRPRRFAAAQRDHGSAAPCDTVRAQLRELPDLGGGQPVEDELLHGFGMARGGSYDFVPPRVGQYGDDRARDGAGQRAGRRRGRSRRQPGLVLSGRPAGR